MIKYQQSNIKHEIPFVNTKSNSTWKKSHTFKYLDDLVPTYLGRISEIDGSYSAWSFDNITMLDNDTIIIFYGNRAAHYSTEQSRTYMCRYTVSTGAKTISLMPFNGVAQSLIKHNNTWYVFTASKRYATSDFNTWTETDISTSYTPMYGVNFNGRFIALPNTSAKNIVLYSDDYGITWTALNLGNNKYITHGGIANVNGTLVIYCTSTSPTSTASITSETTGDRYVITSEDGITWTAPVKCTGDLEYGGPSYVSGSFEHIGEDWYYLTSNRRQIPPVSGTMNLFKGSPNDVINGTMELYAVVDTIEVDAGYTGTASSVYMTDNGNVGMCTDGESLYCTYNRPLGHSVTTWCSNSMQVLSVMSKTHSVDAQDDYYDATWTAKRDAFVSAKNKNHTWYAYLNDTNITQANMKSGQPATDYGTGTKTTLINDTFEFDADLEFPFTNGFRLEIAFNRFTSTSRGNRIGANINGQSYSAYTGTSNGVFIPAVAQTSTEGTGAVKIHKRTAKDPDYLVLEYNKNNSGKLSAYCNGITINSIRNVCDADTYTWSTSNVVYIESVWSYLNSRSDVGNAELKAFTVDIW